MYNYNGLNATKIAEDQNGKDHLIKDARDSLEKYLNSFPEHDQGDIRAFEAFELLTKMLIKPLTKQEFGLTWD